MTISTAEVYFLVRVGSWGEDELEDWVQTRMQANDDDTYQVGHADGYKEGWNEGAQDMYKQAFSAVKDLL